MRNDLTLRAIEIKLQGLATMSKYRNRLPQLQNALFVTDGGLETTLIFQDGIDLPFFAAFDLLKTASGVEVLKRYFESYVDIARRQGVGIVLETPTWRANPDWAAKLGYDAPRLADANRSGVGLLLEVRKLFETAKTPIVISGNLGPRGDGYRPESRMTSSEAAEYHGAQVRTFAETDADMIAAFTMNYVEEALGIAYAARDAQMPLALSFTLETDGRLPTGDSLAAAIARVDAETGAYPVYYMVNCAHPRTSCMSWRNWDHLLSASADCARMLLVAAMPSSMPAQISMQAIPTSWVLNTVRFAAACRRWQSWAVVAGQIIATSARSAQRSSAADRRATASACA